MSDTGISSEATSFWVLFNLGCDNDNIKKKIVVCSRTAGKSFRGYVIFFEITPIEPLYADTKLAKPSDRILEVSL